MNNRVYNSPNLKMISPLLRMCVFAGCLLGILSFAPNCLAGQWSAPEQQLADKIAAATGPGAFAINVENRSSLSRADVQEIHRELLAALEAEGIRSASADSAVAIVHVTLSEGLQNYIWTAEIRQGTNPPQIVMVSLPRPDAPVGEQVALPITIHKTLLLTGDDQILDIALFNENPQQMIVLEPETVVLYQFQEGRWQAQQTLAISHVYPWPRDLRGRLTLAKDHLFDAYLPGVFCRSTVATPLSLNCRQSDDPRPLATQDSGEKAFFAPSKNFFTGAISPGIGKQVTAHPFYSAAKVPKEKYDLWVLDGVDGQIELLDGFTDQSAGNLGWGSDIASVHSSCGLGLQILATANGEGVGDSIRGFEIPDREFVGVSQSLEFAGRVTALWTSPGGTEAIAISQVTGTEKYEADQLSITCSQ